MTYIAPTKVLAHLDRLVAWQQGQTPAPVTVEFDLSNRCYLGCQSCHFAHTHSRGPWTTKGRTLPLAWEGTGDLADTALVRRALGQMRDAGVRGIVWSGGGEPTTHPDWMAVLQHGDALGLRQGMYTAGGLLTPSGAETLARHAAWVVVSLDALDPDTYRQEKGVDGFARAVRGIQLLAQHREAQGRGLVVGVSFLLHARNWRYAWMMQELADGLGASYVTFRPTIDTLPDAPAVCTADRGWITEALPTLQALAQHAHVEVDPQRFVAYRDWTGRAYDTCHGIKLNATVTPDGRVWVCVQRRGVAGSEVGDLRIEAFQDLWARHTGTWTDFGGCRVMCRLHQVNEVVAEVYRPRQHAEFV